MPLDPVAILTALVAIPSVNPMTPGVATREATAALTAYLEGLLRQVGVPVFRLPTPDGDVLVGSVLGSRKSGPRVVILSAHQDTVGVDGMTVDPFAARREGGRLYGRGACDVKGGMAAMIAAVSRLLERPASERPTLMLAFTVNEECGFTGADAVRRWFGDQPSSSALAAAACYAAIVAEPTGLAVVVAHRGVVRWRCHARGLAVHSSRPQLGVNAIYRMAAALRRIEQYAADLQRSSEHPRCGPPTLSVGVIRGGVGPNTVPDRCTIEIERRLCPGEDAVAARQHLIDHLSAANDLVDALEHEPPYMAGPPLGDDANRQLAAEIQQVVVDVAGLAAPTEPIIGVPYATDAPFFASLGVPTVVFGPGRIEQAHTADEFIELAELQLATDVIERFVLTPQSN